jgi:integrase
MFRDTFAVELLLSGVPIDQVSLLLGHSSVKVTEKHYAPFVKANGLRSPLSLWLRRCPMGFNDRTVLFLVRPHVC